jgi:beta-lactamase regulating signal transducer with metallopeptidase domain
VIVNLYSAILWEGMIHATGFALAGSLVYLALRRLSPAAGSLGAASTLVVMAVLSLLAFCPWPNWEPRFLMEKLRTVQITSGPARGATTVQPALAAASQPRDSSPETIVDQPAGNRSGMVPALLLWLSQVGRKAAQSDLSPRPGWQNWLGMVIVASVLLGFVRLGTGLWAIRRMKSRSSPLTDEVLRDQVALLQAEMGCRKPVQVRVSAELSTPATIGWRQIMILLPEDWCEWDASERRAVLAHELAHICRGDYMVGLLAQLSVAVQFYHPIAHWLSARLRLEQELAADAWSARLSGGTIPYLTTLAGMALRRDDRALSGPARAFLPSRGTFVRRIEMMRNHGPVPHVWLSPKARYLTIGVLASIGLVIAGLRGPIGPSPAQAQGQPNLRAFQGGALDSEKGPFDLAYLPEETRLLIACRPAAAVSRIDLAAATAVLSDLPLPPKDIDQLLIFWEGTPEAPAQPGMSPMIGPPSGVIIRSVKPQDWKGALSKIIPAAEDVAHAGVNYLRPAPGHPNPMMLSAYIVDERTAVCAREDLLRTMIEDRKGKPAHHIWDDVWRQAAKGDVGVALDTRWLRRRLNQGQIKLETIAPLLDKVEAYALGVALDKDLAIDLVGSVGAAEDMKPVMETASALLTLGRNSMPALKEQAHSDRGPFRETNEWATGVVAAILDKARAEPSGQTIHVRSTCPLDLAQVSKTLNTFVQVATTQSSRVIAINNLKQIGLAFHNYAEVHHHFPPPVLYGGKSGKVPYSWRVAILPFLEQSQLHDAYNFDEPWDGPSNRKLIERMPSTYGHPAMKGSPPKYAAYFVFSGPDGILGKGDKPLLSDVTDGLSNTILAVEAKREIPWTKPEDIPFDPQGPLPEVGGLSLDGVNTLLGDGSVRFISKAVNPNVLKALITRAGGEVIASDSF